MRAPRHDFAAIFASLWLVACNGLTGCNSVAGLDDLAFGAGAGGGGGGKMAGTGGQAESTGGGGGTGGVGGAGLGGAGGMFTGDVLWSRSFGDGLEDFVRALAVAPDGAVVLGGSYAGSIDFGGGNMTATEDRDAFLAVLESDGLFRESASYGGPDIQGIMSVGVTADYGFAICGNFRNGGFDLAGTVVPSIDSWDVVLAVMDDLSTVRWAKSYGGASGQDCHDAGPSTPMMVAKGALDGTANFGGAVFDSQGSADGWIAGYDIKDGVHQYSSSFGDAAATILRPLDDGRIAVADDGSVVLVGAFDNTVNFGGLTLAEVGGLDSFVTKLDANGDHVFSVPLNGLGEQIARDVARDDGSVIVVGAFEATMDVGGRTLTSAGDTDAFVVKMDATGSPVWERRFGDDAAQEARIAAVDGMGYVFVIGWFTGRIDFGFGDLVSAGAKDIFIAKLTPDGDPVWAKAFGTTGDQTPRACATDAMGNLFCTGNFEGSLDFGDSTVVSQGEDIWLVKLAP